MIATHLFETARESVLPLWSPAAQARRLAPDARALDLFVFLHSMLFTNIQLDDFSPTLARLLGHLSIEGPGAREGTMMPAINIGALLEYGRPQGVLRRADVLGQLDRNPAAAGRLPFWAWYIQSYSVRHISQGQKKRRSCASSWKIADDVRLLERVGQLDLVSKRWGFFACYREQLRETLTNKAGYVSIL
jgi:hypothetical protein